MLVALAVLFSLAGYWTGFGGEEAVRFLVPMLLEGKATDLVWLTTHSLKSEEIRILPEYLWAVNVFLWEDWYPGFFTTMLALHVVWVLSAWRLLREVSSSERVAFWGAAMLAVHPSRVDVMERLPVWYEPLCGALMAYGILVWIRRARREPFGPTARVPFIFGAAILTKAMALTAPFLGAWLVARDQVTHKDRTYRQAALLPSVWIPLAWTGILWAGYLGFRLWYFDGIGGYPGKQDFDFGIFLLYPQHLARTYGMLSENDLLALTGLALAVATPWLAYVEPRCRPGLVWMALSFAPVINIMAGWYPYIPAMGLTWFLAEALFREKPWPTPGRWRLRRSAFAVLIVCWMGAGAYQQKVLAHPKYHHRMFALLREELPRLVESPPPGSTFIIIQGDRKTDYWDIDYVNAMVKLIYEDTSITARTRFTNDPASLVDAADFVFRYVALPEPGLVRVERRNQLGGQ